LDTPAGRIGTVVEPTSELDIEAAEGEVPLSPVADWAVARKGQHRCSLVDRIEELTRTLGWRTLDFCTLGCCTIGYYPLGFLILPTCEYMDLGLPGKPAAPKYHIGA
jgi:hypothetical protein